ncbi:hypothetical protein BUALT_Bualt01G0197000 [Buddleja alternifolia]|uniref:Uncharacterized protein n=1 Tax=Buddleja alternifolia TaxID=168488 RepID=A0AAV6YED7_9LAMI|nr:hypothetical protein BUALT_Bualt01G0197000 [Buddleja alternifolia]
MPTRENGKRLMSDRSRGVTFMSLLMEDVNNQSASHSDSHDDLDAEQEVNEEVHTQQNLPHTPGQSDPANSKIKTRSRVIKTAVRYSSLREKGLELDGEINVMHAS